jgi:hypothetical protein
MGRTKLILIFTLLVLLLCGIASAGQISTIDAGHYNADEMKRAVPFAERNWANGTYSNTKLDPGGAVTFDLQDRLTMSATLAITTASGIWKWYPANQSGNMVFYRNAIANISYTDWDTILKEQIVLNQPVSAISWQINLSVKPQTLTITTDGDDYLIKSQAYGNRWIRVRKPFVVDAKGIRRDLRYTWNNGQKVLTLVQDFSGLTYPLTIDPVYVVDTTGTTGLFPQIVVNQSNIPQIVYLDNSLNQFKLAVNSSGTWSIKNLPQVSSLQGYYTGAAVDTTTDMPFYVSWGNQFNINFTWYNSGHWISCETFTTPFPSVLQKRTDTPIGYDSTSGRVLFFVQYNVGGSVNITRIETISGSSVTVYQHTDPALNNFPDQIYGNSGRMNASHILNVIWVNSNGNVNWTTATSSTAPVINTKVVQISYPPYVNTSIGTDMVISTDIDPTTGFPGFSSKTSESPQPSALNFSYFNGNHWIYDTAFKNTTSVSNRIVFHDIAYNSSGTPYIAFVERMGPQSANYVLKYTKRISAGSWAIPVDIRGDSYNEGIPIGFPPAIVFDQQDGLHIAWFNASTYDLNYYYEALPVAAGAAPVAAFSCAPLATVRNGTITCSDQSTNLPTSWDWYSPDAQQQVLFSGNDTRQNPQFFPHKLGGYFSVNLIATNAYGTSTKASGPRYIWVQKPWV